MSSNRWKFSIAWSSVIFLCAFSLLGYAVSSGGTTELDRSALLYLRGFSTDYTASPLFREILRDITSFGSMTVLFVITLSVAGYLGLTGRSQDIWTLLAVSIGGLLLISCLKLGFSRARPDLAVDGVRVFTTSFPSEHAALSTMLYLTVARLIAAETRAPLASVYCFSVSLILIVAVGVSRVCLGIHYPADILAGWSIGAAWAMSWRYVPVAH